MEIGKTLYVTTRQQWRSWLAKHHKSEKEIWLVYYKKDSGKARIPYDIAVEEALCFGWIDSIVKSIDKDSFAQRFTPRRSKSQLSELNRERMRKLIEQKKMTPAGLNAVKGLLETGGHSLTKDSLVMAKLKIKDDILKALKQDKTTWKNFSQFDETYKRIRIGWIEVARYKPHIFNQRLSYFLKMTAKNKKFGTVQ